MALSYCHARLSLLLQLAQTRFGAAAVLNAGLFHSITESSLFLTDPDLGVGWWPQNFACSQPINIVVDIPGPNALNNHYNILVAIMRIVCAALLSRGTQNQQSLEQGRRFLTENRLPILAVLKKSAGLGSGVKVTEAVDELADAFMLLVSFTEFLEVSLFTMQAEFICTFTNNIIEGRRQNSSKDSADVFYVKMFGVWV